eukprot:6058308-Prymnesium_polylepis.1
MVNVKAYLDGKRYLEIRMAMLLLTQIGQQSKTVPTHADTQNTSKQSDTPLILTVPHSHKLQTSSPKGHPPSAPSALRVVERRSLALTLTPSVGHAHRSTAIMCCRDHRM